MVEVTYEDETYSESDIPYNYVWNSEANEYEIDNVAVGALVNDDGFPVGVSYPPAEAQRQLLERKTEHKKAQLEEQRIKELKDEYNVTEGIEEVQQPGGQSVDPSEELGFEVQNFTGTSFAPKFYPEEFVQSKEHEMNRYGASSGGETVSKQGSKNRNVKVSGKMLHSDVPDLNEILSETQPVDLYNPLTPRDGLECHVKKGEIGNQVGFEPEENEWIFEYSLELISTGRDEYGKKRNGIVSSILNEEQEENITENTDSRQSLNPPYSQLGMGREDRPLAESGTGFWQDKLADSTDEGEEDEEDEDDKYGDNFPQGSP